MSDTATTTIFHRVFEVVVCLKIRPDPSPERSPPPDLISFPLLLLLTKAAAWETQPSCRAVGWSFWLQHRSCLLYKAWQQLDFADLNMAQRITLFRAVSFCSDHSGAKGHFVQPHAFKGGKNVKCHLNNVLSHTGEKLIFSPLFQFTEIAK